MGPLRILQLYQRLFKQFCCSILLEAFELCSSTASLFLKPKPFLSLHLSRLGSIKHLLLSDRLVSAHYIDY